LTEIVKTPYPDHPNRCQAVSSRGQCPNLGLLVDDTYMANCIAHGGARQRHSTKQESLRNYRLGVWQARVDEKVDAVGIKGLRDEIGILRVILEERLTTCRDSMDLILQSAAISDMVMKIERVVTSCHKLEGSMGHLLDKQAILQFAQVVIGIIGNADLSEAQLNTIAEDILQAVGKVGTE